MFNISKAMSSVINSVSSSDAGRSHCGLRVIVLETPPSGIQLARQEDLAAKESLVSSRASVTCVIRWVMSVRNSRPEGLPWRARLPIGRAWRRSHGRKRRHSVLAEATLFVLLAAAAWAGIISLPFHESPRARWPANEENSESVKMVARSRGGNGNAVTGEFPPPGLRLYCTASSRASAVRRHVNSLAVAIPASLRRSKPSCFKR